MLTNNVNSTIIESYENNELGIGVRMSAIFLVTLPFILFFTIIFYYIKKYHRTRQFIQVDAQNHLQNDEGGQTEVLKATSETVLTSSSDLEFGADENQTQETKEAMLLSSNKSKDVINAEPARSIASSKPAVAFPAETSNAVILSTFTAWMNQHLYSSVENSIRANNRQSVDPVEIDHDLDEDNEDQRSIQTRHTKGPSSSNTLYSVRILLILP